MFRGPTIFDLPRSLMSDTSAASTDVGPLWSAEHVVESATLTLRAGVDSLDSGHVVPELLVRTADGDSAPAALAIVDVFAKPTVRHCTLRFVDGTALSVFIVTGDAERLPAADFRAAIRRARRSSTRSLVVAAPYWSAAGSDVSDAQRTFAVMANQAGAALVVGSGAKYAQAIDVVAGRLRVHDLGGADETTRSSRQSDEYILTVEIDLTADAVMPKVLPSRLMPSADSPRALESEEELAQFYSASLTITQDSAGFLEGAEPFSSEGVHGLRFALGENGRIPVNRRYRGTVQTTTKWEATPETIEAPRSGSASTTLFDRALTAAGATYESAFPGLFVGESPDGRPFLLRNARSHISSEVAQRETDRKENAREILNRAGIAVSPGQYFSSPDQFDRASTMLSGNGPLVVKPVDGRVGIGVTVGVTDLEGLRFAWKRAFDDAEAGILIEEQFFGQEVRVLIVRGRTIAVALRIPPRIVGDGTSTIRDLINAKNARRHRDLALQSRPIELTPTRLRRLAEQGLGPLSVLPAGETYVIDVIGNVKVGAEPADVTDTIHPSYKRIAERAAACFPGMHEVGVDIYAENLEAPAEPGNHVVMELNGNPDIALHISAVFGKTYDVARTIVDSALMGRDNTSTSRRSRRSSKTQRASETTTSEELLAFEFETRGLDIRWTGAESFHAVGEGEAHSVWRSVTNHTGSGSVAASTRPAEVDWLLRRKGLPVPEGRNFTRRAQKSGRTYARDLGAVHLRAGTLRPIPTDPVDTAAFAAAWATAHEHAELSGVTVNRRCAGTRVRVIVAHGRALAAIVTAADGAAVTKPHLHRSYRALAAEATRAIPGLDLAEVTLVVDDPRRPASANTVVVEDVRPEPDLIEFRDHGFLFHGDLARRIVDLHLGSPNPRPEPPLQWQPRTGGLGDTRVRIEKAARSVVRRIRRRIKRSRAQAATPTGSVPATPQRIEQDGLTFELRRSSARLVGASDGITDLAVPDSVMGRPVTSIAAGSLRGHKTLRRLVVPATVTTFGADSFRNCANLEHVELPPELPTIRARAFQECQSLRTVILPTRLERIATRAFADCPALAELQYFTVRTTTEGRIYDRELVESALPQQIDHIGVGAFENCTALQHIAIPHQVTRIRSSVFAGCTALTSVWLHSAINKIDEHAFGECTALTSIRVPDSLDTFAPSAFSSSTAVSCAEGSTAHRRASELGFRVAPVTEPDLPVIGACGVEAEITVRKALADRSMMDQIRSIYEVRPATWESAPDTTTETNAGHSAPPRFRLSDGVHRSRHQENAGKEVDIAVVGDLMCGAIQQRAALRDGRFDFSEGFTHVAPVLHGADLALGNLETMVSPSNPLAADTFFIDGRPHLNAPASFLSAVREAGFDAVLNAQNHMYDTGTTGVYETLDALNRAGLIHGGLYASAAENRPLLFSVHGIRIGVVAFLDPARQRMKKASFTPSGLDSMASFLDTKTVHRDITAARKAGAEFVLAFCHWGAEYTDRIGPRQNRFARMVAEAGADYVFGSHSHCPQRYEVISTDDGREVPVVFSGGNFLGCIEHHRPITLDTFISSLTLARGSGGKVAIVRDGYLPCRIVDDERIRGRVAVVPLDSLARGAHDYDATTAREDQARIQQALGPAYTCLSLADLNLVKDSTAP